MLLDLMDLDYKKTIALLLETHTFSSDEIVEKLKQKELHLYQVRIQLSGSTNFIKILFEVFR